MTTRQIEQLAKRYRATGRLAFVYPRLKRVSLNGGGSLPYKVAAQRMRELLAKR